MNISCIIGPFGANPTIKMHFEEFQDFFRNFKTSLESVRNYRECPITSKHIFRTTKLGQT